MCWYKQCSNSRFSSDIIVHTWVYLQDKVLELEFCIQARICLWFLISIGDLSFIEDACVSSSQRNLGECLVFHTHVLSAYENISCLWFGCVQYAVLLRPWCLSMCFWSIWILSLLADCPLGFIGFFLVLIYRHSLQIKEICLLSVIYVPNSSRICHWTFVFVYGVCHAENCYVHVIGFIRFLILWPLGFESL